MVKAVPGFLQVSDLWRWVLSNVVALFSGLTVCARWVFNARSNDTRYHAPSSKLNKMPIALNKLLVVYSNA
eukprot:4998157-Amphidinium_carterae.1